MWLFFRHPLYFIIKTFYVFFPYSIRMSGKNLIFNDKKISRSNFYKNKKRYNIYDIEIDKILIS